MEFSIKMLVVIVLVLIVFAVSVVLISSWGGQSNSAISGLFKFFEGIMGGKQITAPSLPGITAVK